MTVVYTSTMKLAVTRREENELLAETTLLTTDMEAVGWISTDVENLAIKDCHYAVYRNKEGETGLFPFPDLIGAQAYLNAGSDLKRVLGAPGLETAREVIAECIRGAVQAESFFFKERGYATVEQYDAFWKEMYADSCRYYSHLEQIEKPWMEYVGYTERAYNLFNRSKTVALERDESGSMIHASFIDSFHELGLQLTLDQQGLVTKATGNFLRAPANICWENSSHLPKFIGCCLPDMGKRDIAALAGGSEGCNHLVDLLYEAARAATR